MPEYALHEVEEQAVKAGRYFARSLYAQGRDRLAFKIDGAVVVVAIDVGAAELEKRVSAGDWMVVNAPTKLKLRAVEERGGITSETKNNPEVEPVDEMILAAIDQAIAPVVHIQPRLHASSDPKWAGKGGVHLHVLADVKLKRRSRLAGECLCSKKHGSKEVEPSGDEDLCAECVKVARENGLPVPAHA